ncbi:MAG TPA: 3-phosphoserine/phosphohydroxythreonine transaminase [Pseudomonadota bacterium]|nr:3-phosphoserine/phosphohydroxythreonine transaminase [Pseudomonadota bacterium]
MIPTAAPPAIHRIYNFSAGPGVLPEEVLLEARDNLLSLGKTGIGILEISHRSKEFEAILAETEANLRTLLSVPRDMRVLFLQGGASLQFSMVPMNLLLPGATADYIVTGEWGRRAVVEARRIPGAHVHIAASTESEGFCRVPSDAELALSATPAYVHYTTNNTIFGTQYAHIPDVGGRPLVADMSSDFLSRPTDISRYSLVYAGAQKNAGPAGVTVVLLREEILPTDATLQAGLPMLLNYRTHIEHGSLYNTPAVFAIYITHLVLRWLIRGGGLPAMARRNLEKAHLVYGAIDAAPGFYRGHAKADSRSLMNITFRLPTPALEDEFVKGAKAQGLDGLKGHRSVGGIRASVYNAFPLSGAQCLAQYMAEFARKHG